MKAIFQKSTVLFLFLICPGVFSQSAPLSLWEEKTVKEMSVKTNLKLLVGTGASGKLVSQDMLATLGHWKSEGPDYSLYFNLYRYEVKPEYVLNLDGAARLTTRQTAISMDDDEPKIEIEVVKVNGLEARLAKLTSFARVVNEHVDSLLVLDGKVLYVLTVGYSPDRAEDANRILKSFQVSKAKK